MISRLLGVLLLLFSVHVEALPIYPYTGEVSPILGATVVATGGDVIATYVNGGGYYDDYLYVSSPTGAHTNADPAIIGLNWIFSNRDSSPGDTVDLGNFTAGTVLVFNILVNTKGDDTSQNANSYVNWFSGPAGVNADGEAHAIVDAAYTGPYGGTYVGFEDCLYCGGPTYYEDLRYTFTNVTSSVPEPATFSLLGIGLVSFGAMWRKKKT